MSEPNLTVTENFAEAYAAHVVDPDNVGIAISGHGDTPLWVYGTGTTPHRSALAVLEHLDVTCKVLSPTEITKHAAAEYQRAVQANN